MYAIEVLQEQEQLGLPRATLKMMNSSSTTAFAWGSQGKVWPYVFLEARQSSELRADNTSHPSLYMIVSSVRCLSIWPKSHSWNVGRERLLASSNEHYTIRQESSLPRHLLIVSASFLQAASTASGLHVHSRGVSKGTLSAHVFHQRRCRSRLSESGHL